MCPYSIGELTIIRYNIVLKAVSMNEFIGLPLWTLPQLLLYRKLKGRGGLTNEARIGIIGSFGDLNLLNFHVLIRYYMPVSGNLFLCSLFAYPEQP